MISERILANAMGGRTTRACEGCLHKKARWFCAADDAFLCQACNASVYSTNQLASRHQRVRLETASFKIGGPMNIEESSPAWHQGFTKKTRTPRYNNNKYSMFVPQQHKDHEEKILNLNPLPVVPEIGSEEKEYTVADDDEDQLLFRVPVFDPFSAGLSELIMMSEVPEATMAKVEGNMIVDGYGQEGLPGFLPSDVDLAQFAADVENLLGKGLDNESSDTKDFGFRDKVVKVKDEQDLEVTAACRFGQDFDMTRESFDWNLDYYEQHLTGDEEEEENVKPVAETTKITNNGNMERTKRKISLRLNYDAVISAWASQGSPWAAGQPPELNSDDCWPDCMDVCAKDLHHPYGGLGGRIGSGHGGREARVLRYKEKRRTRLFSKKIRYEVRKLNAEQRPRMKGRFVKRTSFMGTSFPILNK